MRFSRPLGRALLPLMAALAAPLFVATAANAQFFNLAASGFQIEHAYYGKAAGGAAPVYALDDGQLLQPGGFLPGLGPLVVQNDTGPQAGAGGFNANWVTAPGLGGTPFGGANTHLFTVNNPAGFGIVSDSFSVADASFGPVLGISANTFGGFADFVNITGGFLNFRIGHFLAIRGQVDPLGGFVAAGVRSVFEFGFGAGGGFVPTSFFVPVPIAFGWDGGIGLDSVQAGQFQFASAGNQFQFAASSVANALLAPGATLRVRGALTIFADPADFSLDLMPLTGLDLPDIGSGHAINAPTAFRGALAAPEPGSLALLAFGGVLGFAAIRRRKTA